MNRQDLKYWLALKEAAGVGNIAFLELLDAFGSLPAIFSAAISELTKIRTITKKTAENIVRFNAWDKICAKLELLEKSGISVMTCRDKSYPANLLNVYDRPALIYVKGSLNGDDINIAIVGSRQASTYGKFTTEKISRSLAQKGLTIVSGLARGIDSAAHRGALAAGGRTIAVLGSGLDVVYPPENKKLFTEITERGAVISEYPLGTPPRAVHFPARNRIISGISYGIVVVEAGEKSGSLITARLALEQGREVFAIPGSIDSAGSRGTNKLIKQGAKLVENTDDILEEILPQMEKYHEPQASPPEKKKEKTIAASNLSAPEKIIIGCLSAGRVHIDDLIAACAIPTGELQSILLALELKGVITQHPGKHFSLKTD